ncbi:unnamed protein product [Vicia faba]|uniref:Uncharacterized protein n=1 Tax=Vicia faba TaxID=3906 RepID=A0AAV1AJN1_VICFA|nr:unnamed protein product [Vicia faba]
MWFGALQTQPRKWKHLTQCNLFSWSALNLCFLRGSNFSNRDPIDNEDMNVLGHCGPHSHNLRNLELIYVILVLSFVWSTSNSHFTNPSTIEGQKVVRSVASFACASYCEYGGCYVVLAASLPQLGILRKIIFVDSTETVNVRDLKWSNDSYIVLDVE